MYYEDHNPPHFHAFYNEYHATFDINTGNILEGDFPKTATNLVRQWCILRREELMKNWTKAQAATILSPVEPLE